MKIAVLSGKGGAGKTFVSVNLAAVADGAWYLDCDVEEPNGHLFYRSETWNESKVCVKLPMADSQKCVGCMNCVRFCRFHALAYVAENLKVFDEVCHSCGGCALVCPNGAITEVDHAIGQIRTGTFRGTKIASGSMNIGVSSGVPIIDQLLRMIPQNERTVIIDCPPGSACSVMESVKDADYCVLVAEASAFGVHDMQMVRELVTKFGKPYGVLINKATELNDPASRFCDENGISVLGRIPLEREIGTLLSDGFIAVYEREDIRKQLTDVLTAIRKEVSQ